MQASWMGGKLDCKCPSMVLFGFISLLLATQTSRGAAPGYQLVNAFGTNAFAQPLCIRSPLGETGRVFVVEKTGLIQLVSNLGSSNPVKTVYMNLRTGLSTSGEQGLLGLAFHPNFQANGYFFVYRSAIVGGNTYERLARFQANPPGSATASTSSEVVLFDQLDRADNHNGGDLHFGNDGYLYVSLGDGGQQDDALNNSQTICKGFHSGLLRIDVDQRSENILPNAPSTISDLTALSNYRVPRDNPFFTSSFPFERNTNIPTNNIRTEFWAIGLRNPWRFSIDPVTGWIWLGDVGAGTREEVDVIGKGNNYGWVYREGTGAGPIAAPGGFTNQDADPVYNYNHGTTATNTGNCVTGGLVYRGNKLAQLTGAYVFCDYSSGYFWAFRYDGTTVTGFHNLLQNGVPLKRTGVVAFGTDPRNGDILLADLDNGLVRRLTVAAPLLTISRAAAGQITLSWPADVGGFDPWSNSSLGAGSSWSRITNSAALSNGRWSLPLSVPAQTSTLR